MYGISDDLTHLSVIKFFSFSMLEGNPKRQAISSIEGYVYQFWHTLLAWVSLGDDEKIYIECGEDFEYVKKGGVLSVQVKNRQDNITLNSKTVLESIGNFWELRELNPDNNISFKYLSTANIGLEDNKGIDGLAGLKIWRQATSSLDKTEIIKDHLLSKELPKNLLDFLKKSELEVIQNQLIKKIDWVTGEPKTDEIIDLVERSLIKYGKDFNSIPPLISKRAANHLFIKVLEKAILKKPEERCLDSADFIFEFASQTHVQVPIRDVELKSELSDKNPLTPLSYLFDSSSDFEIDNETTTERILPDLIDGLLVRNNEIDSIKDILYEDRAVVITGGSGMGKSTISKFVGKSLDISNNWVWISCRGLEPKEIKVQLNYLIQEALNFESNKGIILDDLDTNTANIQDFKNEISILLKLLRIKNCFLIVTSQKRTDSDFLTQNSVSDYRLPALSKNEIQEFLRLSECPEDKIDTLSTIIEIQSKGHPQLVHAAVIGRKAASWDVTSVDEIFSDVDEIQEKKEEARSLLTSLLSNEQLKLIYVLSLSFGSFSRDLAIRIGENEGIEFSGDVFDSLIGPWIDLTSANRYSLSPLLANIANDVWSNEKCEEKKKVIIKSTFQLESLDVYDCSRIAVLSFAIGDGSSFAKLIVGLLPQIDSKHWPAFSTHFEWLNFVDEDAVKKLFTAPQDKFALRMFQYKVAKETNAEKAVEILELINSENPFEYDDRTLLNRIFIQTSAFVNLSISIKDDLLIELIHDFEVVENEIKNNSENYSEEILEVIDKYFQKDEIRALIANHISSKEKFETIISHIKESNENFCKSIFQSTNKNPVLCKHFINKLYINEVNTKNSEWNHILKILDDYYKYFFDQKLDNLRVATLNVKSIIYDEFLGEREKAFNLVLNEIKSQPDNFELENRLATLYFFDNEYKKASNIWDELLPNHPVDKSNPDIETFFSCRANAICHFELGSVQEAENWFNEGYSRSNILDKIAYQAAFLGDAAYMSYLRDDLYSTLLYLLEALKIIERITPIPVKNLFDFGVYKLLMSSILFLMNKYSKFPAESELINEPFVGMITNTFKHEGLKELPNPPIVYAWFQLFQLERSLNLKVGIEEELYKRIDERVNLKYPAIGTFLTLEELRKTFRDKDLYKIPSMIEKIEISFAASRLLRERQISIVQESGIEIKDIENEINYGEITTSILVISILMAINEDKELIDLIEAWKKSVSSFIKEEELLNVLNQLESSTKQSIDELWNILVNNNNNNNKDDRSRLFASIILLSKTNLKPEMLAYASLYLYQYKTLTEEIFREVLSKILTKVWLKKIEARFLFSDPNNSIPKIKAACNDSVNSSNSKIARILLAVLDSVYVPITDEFRKNLEMDAEND